jgi:hypothetical protein
MSAASLSMAIAPTHHREGCRIRTTPSLGSTEPSPADRAASGLARMAPISSGSTGVPRSWWVTPLGRTTRSTRSPARRFHTTTRKAWRILSPSPTEAMKTTMKETLIPLIALSVIPAASFAQNFPMTYGNSDQIITVPPAVSTFTTLNRNDRAYARRQLRQQHLRTKSRR